MFESKFPSWPTVTIVMVSCVFWYAYQYAYRQFRCQYMRIFTYEYGEWMYGDSLIIIRFIIFKYFICCQYSHHYLRILGSDSRYRAYCMFWLNASVTAGSHSCSCWCYFPNACVLLLVHSALTLHVGNVMPYHYLQLALQAQVSSWFMCVELTKLRI